MLHLEYPNLHSTCAPPIGQRGARGAVRAAVCRRGGGPRGAARGAAHAERGGDCRGRGGGRDGRGGGAAAAGARAPARGRGRRAARLRRGDRGGRAGGRRAGAPREARRGSGWDMGPACPLALSEGRAPSARLVPPAARAAPTPPGAPPLPPGGAGRSYTTWTWGAASAAREADGGLRSSPRARCRGEDLPRSTRTNTRQACSPRRRCPHCWRRRRCRSSARR